MKRFVSVGECMIEFGRTAEPSLWARNFAGDTFNTAWYFHYLCPGWQTAYLSAVGNDKASDDMLRFIDDAGIETALIQRIPDRTPGLYTIDLQDGERSFTYWRSHSAARLLARDEAALSAALNGAGEIYFSGITLAILERNDRLSLLECIGNARRAGASVSFDPNVRPKLWNDLAEITDWIIQAAGVSTRAFPTFPDEAEVFGDGSPAETATRYRSYGVEEVVVKNGDNPCLAESADIRECVPAEPVPHLVDTTGAGDSFNGAYLAARHLGASQGESCRFAHRLAARVVTSHGALLPPTSISSIPVP